MRFYSNKLLMIGLSVPIKANILDSFVSLFENENRGERFWKPDKEDWVMSYSAVLDYEESHGYPDYNYTDTTPYPGDQWQHPPHNPMAFGKYYKYGLWSYSTRMWMWHWESEITWTWNTADGMGRPVGEGVGRIWGDDEKEQNSQWFTHPDFKDADGNQKYYMQAVRMKFPFNEPHNATTDLQNGPWSYNKWTDTHVDQFIDKGDCEDCPYEHLDHLGRCTSCWKCMQEFPMDDGEIYRQQGCGLKPEQICHHVTYQDTEETWRKARSWCPESIEEIQEVYAYTMNDVDKRFLSNDFYMHFFTLSKYEYWARWWIYVRNQIIYAGKSLTETYSDGNPLDTYFMMSTYNRQQLGLGWRRKKYRQARAEHNFGDKTCMSGDWNKDAFMEKINPEDEKWESRDLQWEWDTVGGQVMRYEWAYNADMTEWDGKELCYKVAPSMRNQNTPTPSDDKWQLNIEAEPCWKTLAYARPVCVVEGPNVPDSIKLNAINMKEGGTLFDKWIKRTQEIQNVWNWTSFWRGFYMTFWAYIMRMTYCYLGCCFCCCNLPCCWENWACGKGGFCWESVACMFCRMFCYGGFCEWKCIPEVKEIQKIDMEKKRINDEKRRLEEASSSSSSSSSSDSD